MLAAGDTFRAAAVEQLKIWGERANVPVIARGEGADPAGLAFDAFTEAKAKGIDLLLIDTAGRLQNKAGLMEELAKIVRVIKKVDPTAPHDCLLVLDATVGQNAHSQVDIFKQICQVTGLVVTKLDGSAKGGVLVALAERFGLPVVAIGVGEGQDDDRDLGGGEGREEGEEREGAAQRGETKAPASTTGRPASRLAMCATLRLSSPAWLAQPYSTSDTEAQSTLGLRAMRALMGMAPRSSVRTLDSAPP